MPKEYQLIRLSAETYRNLQFVKTAYEACYAKTMTFDEVVKRLITCLNDADDAVYELYSTIWKNYENQKVL